NGHCVEGWQAGRRSPLTPPSPSRPASPGSRQVGGAGRGEGGSFQARWLPACPAPTGTCPTIRQWPIKSCGAVGSDLEKSLYMDMRIKVHQSITRITVQNDTASSDGGTTTDTPCPSRSPPVAASSS